MPSLEETFEQAVKDGILPGAMMMAKTKDGHFEYANSFGTRSLDPNSKPLGFDSIYTMASMTKLLTSIAVMQVVEKGLISLHDDASQYLPEIANLPILGGIDSSGTPVLNKRKNPIKLVYLLTHSSGATYEAMDPTYAQYRKYMGQGPPKLPVEASPLRFEPGTSWMYGSGLDWAGRVVERLTGDNLQVYMQKNMFDPLGIERIAFSHLMTAEMKADLASMVKRDSNSGKVIPHNFTLYAADAECYGGHGGSGDLRDYFKIVFSLLTDDEALLKKESTAVMFSPQLTPEAKVACNNIPPTLKAFFIGDIPDTVVYDWGIGGLLTDADDKSTSRRKGFMMWSGMPNLFWFIDREAGLCGVFGTQVFPPGDKKVGELISLFERTMFQKAGLRNTGGPSL